MIVPPYSRLLETDGGTNVGAVTAAATTSSAMAGAPLAGEGGFVRYKMVRHVIVLGGMDPVVCC